MPTALTSISIAKEQAATYCPLLLCDFLFSDASHLRLSTHPLNTGEGGQQYGGYDWLGRISQQAISQVQALSETGVDLIPSVRLDIADPDSYVYINYEKSKGLKGAQLTLTIVFYDPVGGTFSSDSRVAFIGICEHPGIDVEKLTVNAVAKTSLMRAMVPTIPIQPRCPLCNPTTLAERALAASDDSAFWECGETRDLTTAPPCEFTKATCTQLTHFAGITWTPPSGAFKVKEYVSGQQSYVWSDPNAAKYGDYFPFIYGTAWVDPPIMSSCPDGNYIKGEAVVCVGQVEGIQQVLCNDSLLDQANQPDGTNYTYGVNKDYWWRYVNDGRRGGTPNVDTPWNSQGDPYGNLCAIEWSIPRGGQSSGVPKLRVLVKGPKLRKYQAITSITVSSNVAVATLVGANTDIASNDASYEFTISGSAGAALNATWTHLTDWAWGPPGTFTWTTSGVADGAYAGGYIAYRIYTENAAWVIADLLTWTNYTYADLDVASWTAAAQVVAAIPCSLVVRQRRSAMDVIRGLRQAYNLLLAPDPVTGKLQLIAEQTLCDQQTADFASDSNYHTGVSSIHADGTSGTGYVAYRFDAASILESDKPTSLVELPRPSGDSPNKIQFAFQDRAYQFAQSSISVIDSDDIGRMGGQEIAGSLAVQPEGLTSYADSLRQARVALAKIHRGNEGGDTRGTRYFEFMTSFRALHLRVGHLVLLNDARLGLSNQLVRATKIQPAQNWETAKLTVAWHADAWYTTAYGSTGTPAVVLRRHDALDRPPFAWAPNQTAPLSGDGLFDPSDKTFALWQEYVDNADGSQSANLSVIGRTPVNVISLIAPPAVPLQASTSDTGGTIIGDSVVWLQVCSKDAGGLYSAPSFPIRADLPAGSTCTITVGSLAFPTGATGYAIFAGYDPNSLQCQDEGATTPASITLTALLVRSWGVPDGEFDHIKVYASQVQLPGCWTNVVQSVTADSITVTLSMWSTDEWAGRVVSILGYGATADQPLCNFLIASNDTNTLTLDGGAPSPVALGILPGDWLTIRCQPTSSSSTSITDVHLGMIVNEYAGSILRVISGTGKGQALRIKSNTLDTIQCDFKTTLDATSRFIVQAPSSLAISEGDSIESNNPAAPMWCQIGVPNVAGQALVIEAVLVDGGGNESPMIAREAILLGSSMSGGEPMIPTY
jgi:hypothetical protein